MDYQWEILGEGGLQFFGKMSAALSHEMKNVLATVNENAGLIQDYIGMVQSGKPLDVERVEAIAGKIRGQVQRADSIVKNLNRLAHSVDEHRAPIEVNELMTFLLALCGRISSARNVRIDLTPSQGPATMTTNPFFLENLLWLCLDFAMDLAGEDKRVGVFIENSANGLQIRLAGLVNLAAAPEGAFPGKEAKALLDALGAAVTADPESGELVITFFEG